ncbi:MAG TPA: hypothetical protein VK750_03900 [Cytophagaceae bacterium]|jgi:hypothetical protein|nr:hypothetical protein [Cytophagaceae bacterium]
MRKIAYFTGSSPLLLVGILALFILSADVPKLHNVTLVDGINVLLPKDFLPMSDDDIGQRYPSTKKPVAFYTSLDRTVDFGLNISKSRWSGVDIDLLHKIYKSTIIESYEKVDFIKDTVQYINGRPYSVFEFVSTFDKTTKYQYFQFTILAQTKVEATQETGDLVPGNANHILIFNMTTPSEDQKKWQPTAAKIMSSIRINANKASKAIPNIAQPEVKGLTPKTVLEQQNKNKSTKK